MSEIAPAADGTKSTELTLSANVAPTLIAHAGVSVSVLTEQELQRLAPATVAEVLRVQPGVHVAGAGGLGAPLQVYVRGEDSHRTQLWIDGMPISNPALVQVAPVLSTALAGRWQRVEILRGPQGLPYGADAGGVVSLISPSTDQTFAADVQMQAGGYNSHQVDGNFRGNSGRLNYFVSGAQLSTQGFSARPDDATADFDGVHNTVWHSKLTLDVTARQEVKLVYRQVDQELAFDNCQSRAGAATNNCGEDIAQRSGLAAWSYESVNSGHFLSFSESKMERDVFAVQEPVTFEQGGIRSWRYSAHHRFGEPLTLTWGADYKIESRAGSRNEGETENTHKGAYLEGLVSVSPNFQYSIAARLDDNDDYGDHTSYRFSGAYLIPTEPGTLKIRAAYGTGFRAPSLLELQSALISLPLTEEHTHGGEFGIEWDAAAIDLGAVVYQTKIEDRIVLQSGGGYAQIDGVSSSKGVELFASVALGGHIELHGNYTFNETRADHQQDAPRWLRPQNIYNVALRSQWLGDVWQLDLSGRGVRYSERNAFVLEDYNVITVTSRYRINDRWRVHLRVENAADALYQEAPGYATSRRKAYLGTQFSF